MHITQDIIDRFNILKAGAAGLKIAYYERGEALLNELIRGERELWAELCYADHVTEYVRVQTEAEIRGIIDFCSVPSMEAVLTGFTPLTAYRLDEALAEHKEQQRESGIESTDTPRYSVWVGDYDEYGAECGSVMDALFPRPDDAPPDQMMQELIDRHGLNEDGSLAIDYSKAIVIEDLEAWFEELESERAALIASGELVEEELPEEQDAEQVIFWDFQDYVAYRLAQDDDTEPA